MEWISNCIANIETRILVSTALQLEKISEEIQQINSLDDLTSIIDNFDAELSLPLDAYRIPRSHTGGPKDVSLPDGWLENPYENFELSELAGQFASGG